MANTLPKIKRLDNPAKPDSYGLANSPLGFFMAAWEGKTLVRLTLLPAHVEKDLFRVITDYHLLPNIKQDNARAKELVNTHLFKQNNWQGKAKGDLQIGFFGTDFQYQVMKQMLAIPFGKTLSYGEVAFNSGGGRAARAVGSICAKNPIAFIVPCHRVTAANGMGGYGYGTALKRQLLQWEKTV